MPKFIVDQYLHFALKNGKEQVNSRVTRKECFATFVIRNILYRILLCPRDAQPIGALVLITANQRPPSHNPNGRAQSPNL